MDNFNLKNFLKEGKLYSDAKQLNENSPGFDTRKSGEPLPTLESVKAAYEAKQSPKSSKPTSIKEAKKSTLETKLAEIEKEGKVSTLEAKIAAIEEAIETKTQRITTVTEDENLSELMDKKRVREMQKEIKLLEKQKVGFGKMLEKLNGKKRTKKIVTDHQGYDDKEDESLGMKDGPERDHTQSMKARRDDRYGKWGKRDSEDRGASLEEAQEVGIEDPKDLDPDKYYYIRDKKKNDVLHRGPLTANSAAKEFEIYSHYSGITPIADEYHPTLHLPGHEKGKRESNTKYADEPKIF